MKFFRLKWLLSKRRFLITIILDYIILITLILLKKFLYIDIININAVDIISFGLIWFLLSYIFGVYILRINLFLIDSIKICIKNTSKLSICISLIYLVNSIVLKNEFLSSNDILFSFNFVLLYILITCLIHILIIFVLYRTDSKFHKWILIGNKSYQDIFTEDFYDINYKFKIKVIDNIQKINFIDLKKTNYKGIIICPESLDNDFNFSLLQKNNLSYLTIKDWCQIYIQRFPPEILRSSDILRMNKSMNEKSFEMHLKRLADIFVSLILLIILSPILLFFSILIFIEDGGPVIYSQIRNGLNFKQFRIYKLRSMKVNSEEDGAIWATSNDSRISRVGKFIRATRIDELPQLWSVLKGEMSLIGPRPERPQFDELLNKRIPLYHKRYSIKPGLSGWAQVNYPYGASERDSYNKLSYDLFYLENFSFFFDFLIFFKTIRLVINARGSEEGSKIL